MSISQIPSKAWITAGATLLGGMALQTLGKSAVDALTKQVADESVSKALQWAKAGLAKQEGDSLISYTQSARVEPILLLDERATYIPITQDVIHTMSSLFTAYYLQAVALDTTLSGVKVLKRLDKFNPDRNLSAATSSWLSSSLESAYKHGLPFPGAQVGLEAYGISMEADDGFAARDVAKIATDIQNMAVGQMIEVTITENGHSAKIPITVRLRVTGMPSKSLVETLSLGGVDVSAGSRYRQWRAGEKRFWADIVLCTDRIDAHRQAAMKDNSGYYSTIAQRNNKAVLAELAGQGPSIGQASSIIVMTEQTKQEFERNVSGRLSDFRTRQRVFEHSYAMLIAVIDPEWNDVTIYHRGIEMPTELNEKDLKTAGGSKGPDVAEILKAYQLGSAPSRL